MYGMDEFEEDKEEVEGTVLGSGGDELSIIPVFTPCGRISVSSLGYFLSVSLSSKTSHPSLPIYLGVHRIQ